MLIMPRQPCYAGGMHSGTIFRIKRYALHDGPGIRTTVFFKGCPLACPWCHNPEGIAPEPQIMRPPSSAAARDEIVGRVIGVDALITEIEKDLLFFDESGGGVTFSGGEPLQQPQFLEALLTACRLREIHTVLDTSGFAPAAVFDRLLPLLQLVLFDIKVMDAEQHVRLTGASNRPILRNLRRIAASGTPVRIRIPLIPGVSDTDANISAIIRVADALPSIGGIDLLPFHRIGVSKYRRLGRINAMAELTPPAVERVHAIKHRVASAGFDVSIGG